MGLIITRRGFHQLLDRMIINYAHISIEILVINKQAYLPSTPTITRLHNFFIPYLKLFLTSDPNQVVRKSKYHTGKTVGNDFEAWHPTVIWVYQDKPYYPALVFKHRSKPCIAIFIIVIIDSVSANLTATSEKITKPSYSALYQYVNHAIYKTPYLYMHHFLGGNMASKNTIMEYSSSQRIYSI